MSNRSTFKRLLAFIQEQRKLLWLSLALSFISVVCGLLPYLAIGQLIRRLWAQTLTFKMLTELILLAAAAFICKFMFHSISTILSHRCAFLMQKNIRTAITAKMEQLSLGQVLQYSSGTYKNLILDEVEKLEYPIAHAIPEVGGNLLAFILMLTLMVVLDWRLTLAACLTLPVGLIVTRLMYRGYQKRYETFARSGEYLNQTLVEYISGIEVIKVFGRKQESYERLKTAVYRFRDYTLAWYRHNWPYNAVLNAVFPAAVTGVIPIGLLLFLHNRVELTDVLLFILFAQGLTAPLIKIAEFEDNFAAIIQTEQKVQEFLALPEMPQAKKNITLSGHDIVFHNVSFSYGDAPVIRNVSLQIPTKTTAAFVGPSGSGKSTLLKLIFRFWDVCSGQITIGGRNLRDIPAAQLSQMIAFVSQDAFLFDMTIRENLLLADPDATDEQLAQALRLAYCDDIIHALPQGIDSCIGENGELLSGGQKQRLCIARAFLGNAPILLLDEITANVDMNSELHIQQALSRLAEHKTVIMVAHRLNTIRNVDTIFVLKDGELKAQGRHDELLAAGSLYSKLLNASKKAENWSLAAASSQEVPL